MTPLSLSARGYDRVRKVAGMVADHFRQNIEPLGYKAFLVAVDREACAFYKEALGKKWKNIAIDAESADSVDGAGDDGRFELRRKGAIVTSVEGLPPEIH